MNWLGPQEWQALALSLRVAFWATLASLPIGIFIAYVLARWRFPGHFLLNALVFVPLILPPVVTGYLLLITLSPRAPVGAFLQSLGIVVAFDWTGAAIAAAIMAFPLMVRAIRLSIEAIDVKLESAASTLGASPLWVFFTVTFPLALPGILAGAVMAFAKAIGEFGATITFVSNIPGETQTIPSAIYSFLQIPGGETAALRLATISLVIAFSAVIASEIFSRRLAKRIRGS